MDLFIVIMLIIAYIAASTWEDDDGDVGKN